MPRRSDDEDDDMIENARKFWEYETGRGSRNEDDYPFLGGDMADDEGPMGGYDEGEEPIDWKGILDNDENHDGAELAYTGYDLSQLDDAIEYCHDAPLGILKIWIEGDEIEIWRYPS